MRPNALILCPAHLQADVFPESVVDDFRSRLNLSDTIIDPAALKTTPEILGNVEVIVSTWGMPKMDEEFLGKAPHLRAVFYAAGSVKGFVTEESWNRGIVVASAWAANAVPVAEYTLGAILLSLKRFWHFSRAMKTPAGIRAGDLGMAGCYRSKVGLISLGSIGRRVARLLHPFEITVQAFDPYLPAEQASELGVTLAPIESIFRDCDVVSIHTPWIPQTERMITGALVDSMKPGATLINTSRGAVLAEDEMCEVLARRPDLSAVLDVTYPEPAASDSPLRTLPNILLTPHIAGSMQKECSRMASWMAEEAGRYVSGDPLRHAVTREMIATMA